MGRSRRIRRNQRLAVQSLVILCCNSGLKLGKNISQTRSGLADNLNTERRPQSAGRKSAIEVSACTVICRNAGPLQGSRLMVGSLNNRRPAACCRGGAICASDRSRFAWDNTAGKTQGTPRPNNSTSRTNATCRGASFSARRSESLGNCTDWLSTSTLSCPSLACCRRLS